MTLDVKYALYVNRMDGTHIKSTFTSMDTVMTLVRELEFKDVEKNVFVTIEIYEDGEMKLERDLYTKRNPKNYVNLPCKQLEGWI